MGTRIQLTAADGHRCGAFRADPAGTPRGAIVVVQEIFGVNSHIRSVCDGFARDGYVAIAPALFDRVQPGVEIGYSQAEIEQGIGLKGKVALDQALQDIQAAVAAVRGAGKVGIVGYCWGGFLAWQAAAKVDGLAASVAYYGGGVPDAVAVDPRIPVLMHFGRTDHAIPLAGVERFSKARPAVSIFLYDAGHGFNCDQRASYDAASAKVARERTLSFFAKHVG